MLTRRAVTLPQGTLSYLEKGKRRSGEPTFVLLHGLMGTAAVFSPLMEALLPERHGIALDLPGAGHSDRDPQMGAHLGSLAHCVEQALDALGLEKVVLVGHSHGGAVALCLAASEPARVAALGLFAPAHPYFRQADSLIQFYRSPVGKAFAHTLPWLPRWVHMAGLRRMAGPQAVETPERLAPYRENLRTRGTVPFLLRLLRSWHSDMRELEHRLEAPLHLPVLLLWGDGDRVIPVSSAAGLRKHLTGAEFHVLPGVGHRPAEERPEACAALLEHWWAQIRV